MHLCVLAALYAAGFQALIILSKLADPTMISLFQASSILIVAAMQSAVLGEARNREQWKAILSLWVGLFVVRFNPCSKAAGPGLPVYAGMLLLAALAASCAVRHEYLLKNLDIGLHVQNIVLFLAGSVMNLLAFFLLPAEVGFFAGYDDPMAISIVVANAMIGVAITVVYKYMDAITKCIVFIVAVLAFCIIKAHAFDNSYSITMYCGVAVVAISVFEYTSGEFRRKAEMDATGTVEPKGSGPGKAVSPGDEEESRLVEERA